MDYARWIAIVAGAIVIVSFAIGIWLTRANAPWAFFSLLTRAWELGLGAFLAIGATQLARIPERPAAVTAWVGLGLIGLSGIVLDTATPYPGTAALLPTVGSALVIAGGFRQSSLAPGRWLSKAVPRFLGRISYSLYLWHWPLLVIPAAALDSKLPWWARAGLVAASIGCAWATQRWVESPFRHGRWIGMLPRRNLAMAATLTLVVASVSLGIGVSTTNALRTTASTDAGAAEAQLDDILGGTPSPGASGGPAGSSGPGASASPTASGGPSLAPDPGVIVKPVLPATVGGPVPPDLRPSIADARNDHPKPYSDGCNATTTDVVNAACVYGDPNGKMTVVLVGDSHGLAWFPAVERLAIEKGWRLLNLTKSVCTSAELLQWNTSVDRLFTECAPWRTNTIARIAAEHPALVLLANSRTVRVVDAAGANVTGAALTKAWRDGWAETYARLIPAADHVVVIGDTPRSAFDVPVCLSSHLDDTLACATPFDRAVSLTRLNEEKTAALKGGAGYIDTTRWICPSEPCPAVIGSFMVFFDQHHLTVPLSSALYSRLGDAIEAITGLH